MNLGDVLNLASYFTVQQMLERDMFQKRITEAKPIYLHEFLYPLMQGYDSVVMDVDGEVGGNDQTFNMLVGRDLMKDMKNKEKFVITLKLLADNSTGKKMSKSEGNAIFLSDSSEDIFGKVMSWPDEMILSGFELCTKTPMMEITEMDKKMKVGDNPRDFKLRLAEEVADNFLGEGAGQKGLAHFEKVIQSKALPDEILEIKPSKYDIITVLVEAKICDSTSQARQMIKQNAVSVNDEKIEDIDLKIKADDIVKKGSRFFVKVI
jgi:tyrosyl-tRNA synthetase